MNAPLPVYLINLDRREDRLVVMQERLVDIAFERAPAVEGQQLEEYPDQPAIPDQPRQRLSPPEIACAMSHRNVWKLIVERRQSAAIVLEDDILLSPDAARYFHDGEWLPECFDIIKLETYRQQVWLSRIPKHRGRRRLHELRSPHLGSAAYCISAAGAEKALELTNVLDCALDDLVFSADRMQRRQLQILQLSPAICIQEHIAGVPNTGDIESSRLEMRIPGPKQKRTGMARWMKKLRKARRQTVDLARRIPEKRVVVDFK